MIDMHTHIIPGIDDGSRSVEMSLAMLKEMRKQGVTYVCATSHYYNYEISIEDYLERRDKAYYKLMEEHKDNSPKILRAAEAAYFSGMSEYHNLKDLCIENTNTLMLEMPFSEWTTMTVEEVESLSLDYGFRLVLVHPERFCFSKRNKKMLERLVEYPIALQVNCESLIDKHSRNEALELLELTSTPLLGSDAHNLEKRPVNIAEGRSIVQKKLGEYFLREIDQNSYLYCGVNE